MRPPAQGAPVVASLVVTPPNPEVSSPLYTPSHRSADYQIPPSAWAAPQATPSHVRAMAGSGSSSFAVGVGIPMPATFHRMT